MRGTIRGYDTVVVKWKNSIRPKIVAFSVVYESVQRMDKNGSCDLVLFQNALAEFETGYPKQSPNTPETTNASYFPFPTIEKSTNEHEICDGYLTKKEQQQQLLDEEALREMLEEEARAAKELEKRIKILYQVSPEKMKAEVVIKNGLKRRRKREIKGNTTKVPHSRQGERGKRWLKRRRNSGKWSKTNHEEMETGNVIRFTASFQRSELSSPGKLKQQEYLQLGVVNLRVLKQMSYYKNEASPDFTDWNRAPSERRSDIWLDVKRCVVIENAPESVVEINTTNRGILARSHDNTDDDTPRAKDATDTAIDATPDPKAKKRLLNDCEDAQFPVAFERANARRRVLSGGLCTTYLRDCVLDKGFEYPVESIHGLESFNTTESQPVLATKGLFQAPAFSETVEQLLEYRPTTQVQTSTGSDSAQSQSFEPRFKAKFLMYKDWFFLFEQNEGCWLCWEETLLHLPGFEDHPWFWYEHARADPNMLQKENTPICSAIGAPDHGANKLASNSVWKFLITFVAVLGVWPFTLDKFVEASMIIKNWGGGGTIRGYDIVVVKWKNSIRPKIAAFSVVYESVQRMDENGSCDLVLFQNALAEFDTGYGHPFTMEACWRILKDHAAWTEIEVPSFNKARNN
ncbi:hypothetical protein Tco_1532367 [Tanacetum coccineum]